MMKLKKIKESSMRFEHKSRSETLFKGLYSIRKVVAITSNAIFVVDIKTWSDWMRTLKYNKEV